MSLSKSVFWVNKMAGEFCSGIRFRQPRVSENVGFRIFLPSFFLCAFLAACAPEPAPPVKPPEPSSLAADVSKQPSPEQDELLDEEGDVAFEPSYDPKGLRDPFEPFIKIEKPKPKTMKAVEKVFKPVTPLQRFSISQLSLVGIVWADNGKAKAMIQDPKKKGYVVMRGTFVGDQGGKISEIKPDRVIIKEPFEDPFGETSVRFVSMTLRKPEEEVSP